MLAIALLLAAAPPAADIPADPGFVRQARAACAAPLGTRPRVAGIDVAAEPATPGDVARLRITDRVSGGWLYAYYDAPSERAAWSRAACLGAQLRLLDAALGAAWRKARWFTAAFSTDREYVAPRGETVSRWHVPVDADGQLTEAGQAMVVVTMPHEQVHRYQRRAGAELPRWVGEGHAEWLGQRISRTIAPAGARIANERLAAGLAAADGPRALGAWGGVLPKREAVMRQVPPEDQARMRADPAFFPDLTGRSLRLGPDDVVSDERQTFARYAAAERLFAGLATRHGAARVQAWVAGLTATPGRIASVKASAEAQSAFGEDLAPQLQ